MSYDINFWKLKKPTTKPPDEIYSGLCRRKYPRAIASLLSKLPVRVILRDLQRVFPELEIDKPFPSVQTARGSIEFAWSDRHFRFDFYGLDERSYQRLVRIMRKYDCPLYDPQLDKRYDSSNGMAVGRVPREKERVPLPGQGFPPIYLRPSYYHKVAASKLGTGKRPYWEPY